VSLPGRGQVLAYGTAVSAVDEAIVGVFDLWPQYEIQSLFRGEGGSCDLADTSGIGDHADPGDGQTIRAGADPRSPREGVGIADG
jgi:hypothetical protein